MNPKPPAAPVAEVPVQWVGLYERRRKIQPRSVQGLFARWRWALVWITQLVFYGLPWLPWNGRPAVLFDLGARRFYLFDLVLYPQDFIFLTALLVICAYGLFFVTAVAGRVWCGFACPQTVYTEIFLWVERRLEGERGARLKLDAAPWKPAHLARRAGKHAAWLAIALWTGFTFVGYFTPIRTLWAEAFTMSFGPWEWFWVNFYALATYGNAGFLREQVCKYMCPYARFQGVMFDRDTLIVTYDAARGEPRGTRARSTDLAQARLGSCIDCNLCVHVCPTGIDIRNGLQMECIACTACIDACDGVMDKMRYPRGLIRYTTENGLERGFDRAQILRRVLRPRVLVYGAVLLALVSAFVAGLALRAPLKVDVVRDRAALARWVDGGAGAGPALENVYRLQVMNAGEQPRQVHLDVAGLDGARLAGQTRAVLGPAEARWLTVQVRVPGPVAERSGAGAHAIRFEVATEGLRLSEPSTFVVPR